MLLVAKVIPFDSTDFIIWSICAGVCLALIVSHIYKKLAGAFVRTLIAYEHKDESSAATLDEIKLNKKHVKFILKSKSPIMSYVSVVGGEIPRDENGKYDYSAARFYVEEGKTDKAKCTFSEAGRLLGLIFTLIVIIAISFGLTKLVPIFIAALS